MWLVCEELVHHGVNLTAAATWMAGRKEKSFLKCIDRTMSKITNDDDDNRVSNEVAALVVIFRVEIEPKRYMFFHQIT